MYEYIEDKLGFNIKNSKVLKSGWAGEIISLKFKYTNKKYVIKTYNSSKNCLYNIKQEWTGLNLLYNANYPVPKPIMVNYTDEKPYIVMEQIEGENLWTCYESASEHEKDLLLKKFVKAFVKLHELDLSILNKKLLNNSTITFIEKEIRDIEILVNENKLNSFIEVIDWLKKEKLNVTNEKLSIIHRDYHPWNVIVDKNKNVHIIDLLWGIGDYRFDLAWMYTLMQRGSFEDFAKTALKKYKEIRNENINNFEYFEVLSTLRWLINVTISLKTGDNLNETRNKEFEDFILPLIKKGVILIKKISSVTLNL
ncbi:aminoglycoside phosphotransferase family protein [Clostridium sp. BJN0001]|uniref:aminoglycoside phosphotransferase family protein n=1 Tax=Clostridium sp. BJN0001 TaxID=2930219 RepID=UPI001FD099D5|nr:aminoglycoside phosphotransferase family protein [Clostridium sp. BJN0001]